MTKKSRTSHSVKAVALGLSVAIVLFAATPAASARDGDGTMTGRILLSHRIGGLSPPCDTQSALNGIDGMWFKLDRRWAFALLAPDPSLEASVSFYRRDCTFAGASLEPGNGSLDDDDLPTELGQWLDGPVPYGTAFVYVEGWWGSGAFTLSFSS